MTGIFISLLFVLHFFGVWTVVITKTRLFKYILKISLPKTENFQIKNSIFFTFLLKT